MIVLNLKLDCLYGFEDFEINFAYPKKVVNSIIDNEKRCKIEKSKVNSLIRFESCKHRLAEIYI